MKRKVIQIVVLPVTESSYGLIFALCNDGTIWVANDREPIIWTEVDGPPKKP
jgi:hypothetical protein